MKTKSSVIKTKAESQPIPEAVREVFGTVETPSVLSDEQPKPTKTISRRSRKELLGLTKELRNINPDGKEVSSELYDWIRICLFRKVEEGVTTNHV